MDLIYSLEQKKPKKNTDNEIMILTLKSQKRTWTMKL